MMIDVLRDTEKVAVVCSDCWEEIECKEFISIINEKESELNENM